MSDPKPRVYKSEVTIVSDKLNNEFADKVEENTRLAIEQARAYIDHIMTCQGCEDCIRRAEEWSKCCGECGRPYDD
jgi:hypothetical protein